MYQNGISREDGSCVEGWVKGHNFSPNNIHNRSETHRGQQRYLSVERRTVGLMGCQVGWRERPSIMGLEAPQQLHIILMNNAHKVLSLQKVTDTWILYCLPMLHVGSKFYLKKKTMQWMDGWNVVYLYERILFCCKKEQSTRWSHGVNEPWNSQL